MKPKTNGSSFFDAHSRQSMDRNCPLLFRSLYAASCSTKQVLKFIAVDLNLRKTSHPVPIGILARPVRTAVLSFLLIIGWQTGECVPGPFAGDISPEYPAAIEETAISLDGVWHLKPDESAERDCVIPSFWDQEPNLRNVHRAIWRAMQGERRIGGEDRQLRIPLGEHNLLDITFTPDHTGTLQLELTSNKGGREQFRDVRPFIVE